MPVPTSLSDLSQTPGSNYPTGGESPNGADDYLRAHASLIARLRDERVPVGGICMYDGLVADLPSNWLVCDGTAGTPDLRDRFIVGAGTAYALGGTGGSKDAIAVAHTHTFSGNTGQESANHTHGVSDPGHVHGITGTGGGGSGSGIQGNTGGGSIGGANTSSATTGISLGTESANHVHAYSGTTASTGSSGTNANLPPYYALVFIKRIS